MRHFVLAAVFGVLLSLVAAPAAHADEPEPEIYLFTVIVQGEPGTTFTIEQLDFDPVLSDRVDAGGETTITVPAPGSYRLRVFDEGGRYEPEIHVIAMGQGESEVTFTPQRARGTATGRLTAPRSTDFSECAVHLTEEISGAEQEFIPRPGGAWSRELLTGDYDGRVECPDWTAQDFDFTVARGATTATPTLTLSDGGWYTGTVVADAFPGGSRPVRGIGIDAWAGDRLVDTAYTDASGRFVLRFIEPGVSHRLDLFDVSGRYQSTSTTAEPIAHVGQTLEVDSLPSLSATDHGPEAQIAGIVRGGGIVLDGAHVIATRVDEMQNADDDTDYDGKYGISGLDPGEYYLDFSFHEWAADRTWVFYRYPETVTILDEDEHELVELPDVTLHRQGSVRGTVTATDDPGETDLVGQARLIDAAGQTVGQPAKVFPDGSYDLGDRPAGSYRLAVLVKRTDAAGKDYEYVQHVSAPFAIVDDGDQVRDVTVTRRLAATAAPSVAGGLAPGARLTARPGSWNASATYAYQWLSNGVPIRGATAATYAIPKNASQLGRRLSVQVTATASAGHVLPGTSVSARTGPVKSTAKLKLKAKSPRKGVARLTIRVRAPYATVTGKVQVMRGKKVLRTVKLKRGKAVVRLSRQAKGRKKYQVAYRGSATVTTAKKTVKVKVR